MQKRRSDADLWRDGRTWRGGGWGGAAEEEAQVEVVLVTAQDSQELQTHADQCWHRNTFSWHLDEKQNLFHSSVFEMVSEHNNQFKDTPEQFWDVISIIPPGCSSFSPAGRQILGPWERAGHRGRRPGWCWLSLLALPPKTTTINKQ